MDDNNKEKSDLELIEQIVHMRKVAKDKLNMSVNFNHDYDVSQTNVDAENLSYRVPRFPFIGVTRHDDIRVYVRFHSDEYEDAEMKRIVNKTSFAGVMGDMFKEIWKEAQEYVRFENI